MRCYHFGNFYLSSIQQGIQAAHAQMELFVKYPQVNLLDYAHSTGENPPADLIIQSDKSDILYDWARNHKTMICLNGGMAENLLDLADFMEQDDNPFPWSKFYEEEAALNGTITNVAIVLPEWFYDDAMSAYRDGDIFWSDNINKYMCSMASITLTRWEYQLLERVSRCRLAS